MHVSEIMTREVETVGPDASLQQAASTMEALGVGSLPVCDGQRLVGAITDRDIVIRGVAAGLSPVDTLVRDCMTSDAAYAFGDEEAEEVLERMKTLQIRRLAVLDRELAEVVARYGPDAGAVEEVFVNANPQSTLKLGQARGVCLLALARAGLPVSEYATRLVKKALVGAGGAEKAQVQAMLKVLLPGVKLAGADAADALAVAITHAHMVKDR